MEVRSENVTWKQVVADALRELGGEGHLSEINEIVEGHPKTATNPTWRDTIRRVVRQYRIFSPVPPKRSGVYRLVETELPAPQGEKLDSPEPTINHGIAQGMLVGLGNLYGYETFVPKTDQTTREFQGKRLGGLVSAPDYMPDGPNARDIRQINTLWLQEDPKGLYPVYGFEVEHTTRIKDGLARLLKIPGRCNAEMFVLGPSHEQKELFERRLNEEPFWTHRHRFRFRLYSELEGLYNAVVQHVERRDEFGVVEQYRRNSAIA